MKKVILAALLLALSMAVYADWYQGGSLHSESALAWQQASYENKLATAGDFIATMHRRGNLSPEISNGISNMDDMKVLADALVTQLDDAFEPDPDPEMNRRMFVNQSVNESAVMVMLLMGWLQP